MDVSITLKAGKVIYIKSNLLSLPTYSMSTFKFPKLLCKKGDVIVRQFWCGSYFEKNNSRFFAYKNWDHLCLPKNIGGLGFQKLEDINLSLIFK